MKAVNNLAAILNRMLVTRSGRTLIESDTNRGTLTFKLSVNGIKIDVGKLNRLVTAVINNQFLEPFGIDDFHKFIRTVKCQLDLVFHID